METSSTTQRPSRHDIGAFVGPKSIGPDEGYMAVNVSRGGMALLRMTERDKTTVLDQRFAWVGVPLPEVGIHLNALVEVVYRKQYGPLEAVGVQFRYLAPEDNAALDAYLEHRSWDADEC